MRHPIHGARISIHSPLAGRDLLRGRNFGDQLISIHSPLAGRDMNAALGYTQENISIHSPLAGRDLTLTLAAIILPVFQSTRPSRGETEITQMPFLYGIMFQSTRPSRGETHLPKLYEIM